MPGELLESSSRGFRRYKRMEKSIQEIIQTLHAVADLISVSYNTEAFILKKILKELMRIIFALEQIMRIAWAAFGRGKISSAERETMKKSLEEIKNKILYCQSKLNVTDHL